MVTNYHSHTRYSDGSSEPVEYAIQALDIGMAAYGFSCHAPIPFAQNWCMLPEKLPVYLDVIAELRGVYKAQIEIYAGLEIDYIPGHSSVNHFINCKEKLDYTISSVHYVDYFPDGTPCNIDGRPDEFKRGLEQIWNLDVRLAVKRYFELVREMLHTAPPDIVAHIDKIRMHNRDSCLFDPSEHWYQKEILDTLQLVKESGCIMEINTRALYKAGFKEPYPSLDFIRNAYKLQIPIVMNSDAHKPHEIAYGFDETRELLHSCGYQEQCALLGGRWQLIELQ